VNNAKPFFDTLRPALLSLVETELGNVALTSAQRSQLCSGKWGHGKWGQVKFTWEATRWRQMGTGQMKSGQKMGWPEDGDRSNEEEQGHCV
jgi:hypothetical protein